MLRLSAIHGIVAKDPPSCEEMFNEGKMEERFRTTYYDLVMIIEEISRVPMTTVTN